MRRVVSHTVKENVFHLKRITLCGDALRSLLQLTRLTPPCLERCISTLEV